MYLKLFFFYFFHVQGNMEEELQYRQHSFERHITENYGTITLKNIIPSRENNKKEIIIYVLYKREKNGDARYTILKVHSNYEYILSVKQMDHKNMKILSKYRQKITFSPELSSMSLDYLKKKFSPGLRLHDKMMNLIIKHFMAPNIFVAFMNIVNGKYMDEILHDE